MAFRWRADDSQTLNAGLVAIYTIFQGIRTRFDIFVSFQVGWGGPDPLSPQLDPHLLIIKVY